jgi:hypothetical protein
MACGGLKPCFVKENRKGGVALQERLPPVDILPIARRQGTPTLASGNFLLPWRLACTVPLVAGSYIRLAS